MKGAAGGSVATTDGKLSAEPKPKRVIESVFRLHLAQIKEKQRFDKGTFVIGRAFHAFLMLLKSEIRRLQPLRSSITSVPSAEMNRLQMAATVLITAALAMACGGTDDQTGPVTTVPATSPAASEVTTTVPSTTVAPSTTTTDPPASTPTAAPRSDEEQILDVIERYWWTVGNAFDPPNPDAAIWASVATFENTIPRLERQRTLLDAGEGVRSTNPEGPFVLGGVILRMDSDSATAVVCVVDDADLYDLETGESLAAEALISQNTTELRFDNNRWLVDDSTQQTFFEAGMEDECIGSLPAV